MRRLFCGALIFVLLGMFLPSASRVAAQLGYPGIVPPLLPCSRPNVINARYCRQMEERILGSTVRITIQTWTLAEDEKGYDIGVTGGHATVKDGRYLVTHNHFSIPLVAGRQPGAPDSSTMVFLYDTQGTLLWRAPLSDLEVVLEEEETVVFAHKEAGFFEKLGLESAAFRDWESLPVKEGMEVAQVDWDGSTSRVDWTTVQTVQETGGTPVLVLDDAVLPGASGGGIFWNGYHVANTWRFEEQLDAKGELIDTISVVVLNSVSVVH